MRMRFRGAPAVLVVAVFASAVSFAWQTQEQARSASSDARAAASWKTYDAGGMTYKYPPGWQVIPQLYRTPPQEAAGEPESQVGEIVSPHGVSPDYDSSIWIGGRQAGCEDFGPPCKCFTIYVAVYTCAADTATLRIYDLFLTTIRNKDSNESFHILFPSAQARLEPGKHYTLRWSIKPEVPKHTVDIIVHDTSKLDWRDPVLQVKDVPDTGSYDWLVPASVSSPGPYLIEISFVVPTKAPPPALSAGRIYEGRSNPFYIY